MSAQYIAMLLNGTTPVWQKVEQSQVQISVATEVVSYVDGNGDPMDLPEVYEMTVVDGTPKDHI